ncbi:hypothetical protein IT570_11205 [Candidatus Sumerlaeota bacterium]|nr:hypothetical protein [Candidatus Sumerlaeota bacterium]
MKAAKPQFNKDKMVAVLHKVAKRMDLVALGLIGLLMVIMGWMYISEQDYQLPETPSPPVPLWDLKLPIPDTPKLPNSNPPVESSIKNVKRLDEILFTSKAKIAEDEGARRLLINNMFDLKSVEEQSVAAKEANEQVNAAQRAADARRYDEALTILKGVLTKDPNNVNALQLKKKIDAERSGAAVSAPPAAGTP